MRRWFIAFFLVAFCGVGGIAPAFLRAVPSQAQSDARPAVGQQPVSEAPQTVKLLITVRDKTGRPVADLTAADFRVFEKGKERKVTLLSKASGLPIKVGLLIDISGSRTRQLPRAEEEPAQEFFRKLMTGANRGFVVSFGETQKLETDLTGDPEELARGIEHTCRQMPRGLSALFEAIIAASRKLGREQSRRVLVVVTDGLDNASPPFMEGKALQTAMEASAAIYFLHLPESNGSKRAARQGAETIRTLAKGTGGYAIKIASAEDVREAFDFIADDLDAQYIVGFEPAAATRYRARDFKVEILRKGVTVVARKELLADR